MVKDVYVVLDKQKRIDKNIEEDHVEEAVDFLGATVFERLKYPSFD
jgi:hypothetical protein